MGRWSEHTAELGEVIVETGTGIITKLDDDPARRNARIEFRATHTALRQPVSGWIDKSSPWWSEAKEAAAGRFEVSYRVEVHRKRNVAPGTPIGELANTDKVRDLVVVCRGPLPGNESTPQGTGDGAVEADREPEPGDADPEAGWLAEAQRDATEQRQALAGNGNGHAAPKGGAYCAPCDYTAPDAKAMIAHARTREHLETIAGTPAAERQDHRPPPPAPSPHADRERVVSPPRRGVKVAEARRWEVTNSDGSPNLNSYGYGAVVDFLEFAHYLVLAHVDELAKAGTPEEVRLSQVEALARTLLDAADRVQANTRTDGRHDRMDGSHFQARSAVRTALKVHPVPWDTDADTRGKWLDELVAHASALAGIALDLYKEHEGLQ